AQVSATMSILPLNNTAFDLEATQRRALNAIASAELPMQRSSPYTAKRCETVEGARAPQGSSNSDTRGRRPQMNTQISNKGGFANNFWVQVTALIVVTVVIIALAAKYIW